MTTFIQRKVWPVCAGLLTAFVLMMIFEYANSFIYPLPAGLDMKDTQELWAFTASLPWTAFILVLLGWIVGSFKAGCVTTYLSREKKYRLSLFVGVVLTMMGITNNIMIGHPLLFSLIGLPVFVVFTYLGHRYIVRAKFLR